MATDGVKIIDGDLAEDTYWGIMDLYDGGATIELIRSKFPFPQTDFYDDFDYEIYTTAYALAFWEIGEISEDIVSEVKKVIDKGACVKEWTEQSGIKRGNQRQKELEKLLYKITSSKEKIRKRKKYKLVQKFLFDINDVLSFKLPDSNYYVTVLLDITQYRGACSYKFGKILFRKELLPTIDEIKECDIIGRKIPSAFGMDMTKILSMGFEEMQKQGGIEEILKAEAERTGSYVIGMSMIGVDHKDLMKFTDNFIKLGRLDLQEVCKQLGSLGTASNFEEFTARLDNLEDDIKVFREDTFKITELLAK